MQLEAFRHIQDNSSNIFYFFNTVGRKIVRYGDNNNYNGGGEMGNLDRKNGDQKGLSAVQ